MATIIKNLGPVTAYKYAVQKGYTGTEEEFAELMASYADVAEEAAESAAAAAASATAASGSASTASTKASEAAGSASAAAGSASAAGTKASEAAGSATAAAGSASTASTKADEAAASATAAAGSATTAGTKASEAASSASAAASSKTAAQAAQTAAEAAQTAAETAQGEAEDAAASVSESAAQIATNTADISQLKSEIADLATSVSSSESNALNPDVTHFSDAEYGLAKSAMVNLDYDGNGISGTSLVVSNHNLFDLEHPVVGTGYNQASGTTFDMTASSNTFTKSADGTEFTITLANWGKTCVISDRLKTGSTVALRVNLKSGRFRSSIYVLDSTFKTTRAPMGYANPATSPRDFNHIITLDPTKDECYVAFSFVGNGDSFTLEKPMLVYGAYTDYNMYVEHMSGVYTTSFGETVYGGTYDFVSGKLVSLLDSSGDPLANPVEYDLIPQDITVYSGGNYCSSPSGKVTMEYTANNTVLLSEIKDDIKTLNSDTTRLDPTEFRRGGLLNGDLNTNIAYRIVSVAKLVIDYPATISVDAGFRLGVSWYPATSSYVDSGWNTGSMSLVPGVPYRITVGRVTEDTSEVADVEEFVSKVHVETKIGTVLNHLNRIDNRLSVAENPFKFKPFFSHIGVSQAANDIIIPSQSLADVARTKRLGFDILEINVRETSDSKTICCHGSSGKFGGGFVNKDGTSVADINISEKTLAWIKENVRYVSKYDRYKTAPFTLEEVLHECKNRGVIPMIEYHADKDYTSLADAIMGKNNYIVASYQSSYYARAETDAMLVPWLTSGDLMFAGNSVRRPFVVAMNTDNYNYTDEQWQNVIDAIHDNGFWAGTTYISEAKKLTLLYAGFDCIGSFYWINEIENGNICNLFADVDFADFTTTGTVSGGTLALAQGDTIVPTVVEDSVFLGGGSLHIRFSGTISLDFGSHLEGAEFTSDGLNDVWFSTYFEEEVPTFTITATGATEVYDITYKASRM